jgi:hypothetical protein
MSSAAEVKMDFWLRHNMNVLFIGKHGVGKTAMVKQLFDRHKLNWKYFSASTMDPWVDFIGVPKEQLIEIDGKQVPVLDLVRPKEFATGEIEALFFDEFNRAPKKVRNAVMELIQFKSINGLVFPNLKVVWAAINPEDDENLTYDVEALDPAQKDRFHIMITVPYKPNEDYFLTKYPKRVVDAAIQWWDALPENEKDVVSPRRLDMALEVYTNKGDMRDVLQKTSNVSKLLKDLSNGPITEKLELFMKSSSNSDEVKKWLQNENNFSAALPYIKKAEALQEFFVPLMPKERISALISDDDNILKLFLSKIKEPYFKKIAEEIVTANTQPRLIKKIRSAVSNDLADSFSSDEPQKEMMKKK